MDFLTSQTRENLMRAFAGESQARNRYTIAAEVARRQNLFVIDRLFTFTANQEKEHAAIFYRHLQPLAGSHLTVEGTYPVDLGTDVTALLRAAQHNEWEEYDPVYQDFGEVANREGFPKIAASFFQIAEIERTHGERFGLFADLLEQGLLFSAKAETQWLCLNCGHIHKGTGAPLSCPVCAHDRGYFVYMPLAPYTR